MLNKKGTALSEQDFTVIKTLLNTGMGVSPVSKVVGRCAATVNWIRQSSSLADYHEKTNAYYLSTRPAKKEVKTEVEQKPLAKQLDEHNTIVTLLRAIEFNTRPRGIFGK